MFLSYRKQSIDQLTGFHMMGILVDYVNKISYRESLDVNLLCKF